MKIRLAKKFVKQYSKSSQKIQKSFNNQLKIFRENPLHPLLNNHILIGDYIGHRSINVTGDWRAIFFESEQNKEIIVTFITLGSHSQLYK